MFERAMNERFNMIGLILETEGSTRKLQKVYFFTTKKLKRAPLI